MRPHSIVLAASLIVAPLLCASGQSVPGENSKFKPAELVAATSIPFPIHSDTWGLVVLQAVVKRNGQVDKIIPIREIQSLTASAVAEVKNWRFHPATLDDKPVPSRVEIAVMFNPFTGPATAKLFPLSANSDEDARDLSLPPRPPDVLSALSAVNPLYSSAVLWPGVVLQLRIGGGGEVEESSAVKDLPPFTAVANDALKKWLFAAAHYNGKFISAPIIVAFSFQPPPTYSQ